MAKRRCGCGCACGCLLFCYLYVGTGVGRLSAPASSCYQFCPYFPLCLFSWKSATFVWLVGARARLDAEATSRTCVCGVGMIRACAQNRTLGFTTLAKIIYETYSMCATSRRCICVVFGLWALDVVGTEYHVEYVDHLGLVGEASIRGEDDHGKDRTNRRSSAGMVQVAHLNPLQSRDIGLRQTSN